MANIDLLEGIRVLREKCKWLESARAAAIEEAARIKGVNYENTKVTGGRVHDVSDLLEKAEEKEARYFKRWHDMECKRLEAEARAEDTIPLLKDTTEARVLYSLYVQGQSVQEIADTLHFTGRNIYKIKKRAIAHYNELDL
ncbi:hypothetical protein [uncultured Dialister sp.]|uniref:hypothetical protein n=1 Tax=uncultured Dialister sp. TaxID=278064 RepID=UPI0025E1E1C5|nr:hypothetical protein [uncultured Dialister sp.]